MALASKILVRDGGWRMGDGGLSQGGGRNKRLKGDQKPKFQNGELNNPSTHK